METKINDYIKLVNDLFLLNYALHNFSECKMNQTFVNDFENNYDIKFDIGMIVNRMMHLEKVKEELKI